MISDVNQTAHYAGAQASAHITSLKYNDIEVGTYGFAQHQSNSNNIFTDCAPNVRTTVRRLLP